MRALLPIFIVMILGLACTHAPAVAQASVALAR